jgi:uncharacterized membrane protein YeaQ/YmgE (transglycosylase-associated protein family)
MHNTIVYTALLLLIGLVAGFLAATILGERRRYGIVGYLVVGVIGALGGSYAFKSANIPTASALLTLVAAFAGSVVLILLLRLVRR